MSKQFSKIVLSLSGIVLFLSIWGLLSKFLLPNNGILPSPYEVWQALMEMNKSNVLVSDTISSIKRIVTGFLLAFFSAGVLGVIAYRFSKIYSFIKLIMDLLSSIPPIAWTPLAILWFGIGDAPAYFIVFLGAFFPMFSNFYAGIKGVDRNLINAAKTLGASNSTVTSKVILPAALPQLFVGIKVGLNVAWFNVIAAELIGVRAGLGYKLQLNRQLLASDNVIALMLIIGMIGLVMSGLTYTVSNIIVPWSLQDESKERWLKYHRTVKNFFFRKGSLNKNTFNKIHPDPAIKTKQILSVDNISKSFENEEIGKKLIVFENISFHISTGEVVSIIGPNGCGKSTILNIIAGLLPADSGNIIFEDKRVCTTSSDRTVVFQNFALFDWLTCEENIKFAINASGNINSDLVVNEYLKQAGLEQFSGNYPFQLSGGMKQRLAIMRAIAANPKLILMDEPFASFDPLIRNSSQETILELLKKQNDTTVLIVTHDIDEAIFMSDRIIVLSKRPATIKEVVNIDIIRPRNEMVRQSNEFIFKRNYIWKLLQDSLTNSSIEKIQS